MLILIYVKNLKNIQWKKHKYMYIFIKFLEFFYNIRYVSNIGCGIFGENYERIYREYI